MLHAPLLVDLELLLCFVFLANVEVRLPQPIVGVLIQAVCRHILADIYASLRKFERPKSPPTHTPSIRLEITWPSGQMDRWTNLSVDQIICTDHCTDHCSKKCPRRRFLGSSLVVLAGTLLDALTTPLWKWKQSLTVQSAPSTNSTSPVQFVDIARQAGLNIPNIWARLITSATSSKPRAAASRSVDYDHGGRPIALTQAG